ncbi:MAG: polyphosphate kinase 2 [Bacteroidetes bacterium]|nr:polyphosphate kinase 2 [Bacteroidota bacterium]MCY4232484.1 polyphosphate kinase 2 [Bacteroidota bacterium]
MNLNSPNNFNEDEKIVKILRPNGKLSRKYYESELVLLQVQLARLQRYIRVKKKRIVVLFEGRDAAGKGGAIKRILAPLNPRICRVVALAKPTERESSQWYFQRYVQHLPAGGEMVLFDRSWYNRAGVERVMGFCTEKEYWEFLRQCPMFERMLIQSGIILIKYWFSVSAEEQERRFRRRIQDPTRRWKISPMDLKSRAKWVEYSKAKDQMFLNTDLPDSPWWVIEANDKRRARLNCIHHLLSQIPYDTIKPQEVSLPPLQKGHEYQRPAMNSQRFVPDQIAQPDQSFEN